MEQNCGLTHKASKIKGSETFYKNYSIFLKYFVDKNINLHLKSFYREQENTSVTAL